MNVGVAVKPLVALMAGVETQIMLQFVHPNSRVPVIGTNEEVCRINVLQFAVTVGAAGIVTLGKV